MATHKRQSLVFLISGLLLLCIIFGLRLTSNTFANDDRHPILPSGSNIVPAEVTSIWIESEVITMNVRTATKADNTVVSLNPGAYGFQSESVWYKLIAEVQADFSMSNNTAGDVSLITMFPLASTLSSVNWELEADEIVPRITNFKVQVNGTSLDYTVVELPNPQGAGKPILPWASFPVIYPAKTQTSIHVSYSVPLAPSDRGTELALYYTFQSGAGWSGSIVGAELIVNLPFPSPRLIEAIVRVDPAHLDQPYHVSNPAGQDFYFLDPDAQHVHWTWQNFEPTSRDDFFAWLIDPGIWQGLQDTMKAAYTDMTNGQAMLVVANMCRDVAVKDNNYPSIFCDGYFEMCQADYMMAEYLLPDHPAPYIGEASISLAVAIMVSDAPPSIIASIHEYLELAKELEQAHPEWVNEINLTAGMVEDDLHVYLTKLTATPELSASSTASVSQTKVATLQVIHSETPTVKPSLVSTLMPSSLPKRSTSITTATSSNVTNSQSGGDHSIITIAVAVTIIVAIAAFVVLRSIRGKV
jgi:hypothetical protein